MVATEAHLSDPVLAIGTVRGHPCGGTRTYTSLRPLWETAMNRFGRQR
jgi:hypothetical protein